MIHPAGTIEHVQINLTDAVEAAAQSFAKTVGVNWDSADMITRATMREAVLDSVRVAAPIIIAQVMRDLQGRTYYIE